MYNGHILISVYKNKKPEAGKFIKIKKTLTRQEKLLGKKANDTAALRRNYIPKFFANKIYIYSPTQLEFAMHSSINYLTERILSEKTEQLLEKFHRYVAEHGRPYVLEQHYKIYKIEKKKPSGSGGKRYRLIADPNEKLKELQEDMLEYLQDYLKIEMHDAVHSYRKGRSDITNAATHRFSNHFIKMDIKDFFPSITEEVLLEQLPKLKTFALARTFSPEKIYQKPATKRLATKTKQLLTAIIHTAVTNKGLPQGSPLSPILSNMVLTDFDYHMKRVGERSGRLYTRFCDDLTVSSFYPMRKSFILEVTKNLLKDTTKDAFKIHEEKTHYGKATSKLYITGVKINKEHRISYGHEKKEQLKKDIFQLLMAKIKGEDTSHWRSVMGNFARLRSIEPNYAKQLIRKYADKFNIDVKRIYKWLEN